MKLFVVIFLLAVARTVYGVCDRPVGKEHMQLITDITFPAQEGDQVTFTCEMGYRPLGRGTVTCSGGQWSSLNMKCEIRNCGSAGEVTDGYVDYSEGTEFGASVEVICNDGYIPVPANNKLYCGVNGWDGRLSVCEVTFCDEPKSIANGHYTPVNDQYKHLEAVVYSCERNFILNGSNTLVCKNQKFTPAPPNCVSVECPEPTVNSGRISSGTLPPYKHQASVSFSCEEGHILKGSSSVTCDINSKWIPALPECMPIVCQAPTISNGEVIGGSSVTYKFKDTVTLKCSEGYKLKGESKLTCGENSQWSTAMPECILIQCTPPKVQGGELVGASHPSYKYKDKVVFQCLSGHTMKGESTLTCDQNSQWSPKLPECTLIECQPPKVEHGQLVVGPHSSYKYMDSVSFVCTSGYIMKGPSTVTCALNSQWSPELPQCTRSGGNGLMIGLIILGVLVFLLVIGCCIYFRLLKKKKGDRTLYTEAPKEAETVALS
ncbi:membrane cofactor protein [Periophthalmus magnuspinnatus]|uniref:membrane cofactor protein n=1 Tax=Periophthalmus magnuspinnatus TaxID=409849 RepID=UPI0024363980|nr:membrane cofactor protein [Periophthalmus magnuspinnatus]